MKNLAEIGLKIQERTLKEIATLCAAASAFVKEDLGLFFQAHKNYL